MDKTAVQDRARSGRLARAPGRRDAARGGSRARGEFGGMHAPVGNEVGREDAAARLLRVCEFVLFHGTAPIASSPGDGTTITASFRARRRPAKSRDSDAGSDPRDRSVLTFVKDDGL